MNKFMLRNSNVIKEVLSIIRIVILLSVALVMGGCLGAFIAYYINLGTFNHWIQIKRPYDKPIQILAADCYEVFVKTTKDQIYDCSYESCSVINNLPALEKSDQSRWGADERLPTKLNNEVDEIAFFDSHHESTCYAYYSITNNGNIYKWSGEGAQSGVIRTVNPEQIAQ